MAKKKDKTEAHAEKLYIHDGWTNTALAEYFDVSTRTITTWKAKGKWDEQRKTLLSAPGTIKSLLMIELEKITKGEKSIIDADALSKISKTIDMLDDKISIQVISSALKEFDNWMVDQDPSLAIKFLDFHRKFILHKIQIDG